MILRNKLMSVEENRELIEQWYVALEQGDFETIYNLSLIHI